jgi:hypothetical protein
MIKQKNERLQKKISLRYWSKAFEISKQEVVKSKKAFEFFNNSQLLHLKMIIHGIRKTLSKEQKMMIAIDNERKTRLLR